jgi:acetyl-CoA acetyltransferase
VSLRGKAAVVGVAESDLGEAYRHRSISQMPDLMVSAATESAPSAFGMAGVGPEEVDLAIPYDAFTINTVLFCGGSGLLRKKGRVAPSSRGRISPGGELAVNTSGGGLSYNHPGMYERLLIVEAVRQLRGECGDCQVQNANIAFVHPNGGVLSSQVTAVLGSESTL